jgi:hypothetical protein
MRAAVASACAVLVLLAGWGLISPAGARYDANDQWQGLPAGKGREEVFYKCVACHTTAIIQQQRLNRRVWGEVLQWMEDEIGMPKLSEQDRKLVLDYLVEHFGQDVAR